jgi:hypothetical protein
MSGPSLTSFCMCYACIQSQLRVAESIKDYRAMGALKPFHLAARVFANRLHIIRVAHALNILWPILFSHGLLRVSKSQF